MIQNQQKNHTVIFHSQILAGSLRKKVRRYGVMFYRVDCFTWSSIEDEFLTITCWVRLAPLMVTLWPLISLGTLLSWAFLASGSSGGGALIKKFKRSQITDRETSFKVEVDPAGGGLLLPLPPEVALFLTGNDLSRSRLSSSISPVFFKSVKSTRKISWATSAKTVGDRQAAGASMRSK